MRRLVTAIAVLLVSASASADEQAVGAKKRVAEEAKRVWRAFGDGVAPAAEVGKEARRVLEEHVNGIPAEKRAEARLYTDEVDVMLAKAAWAGGDRVAARERAERVLESLRGRQPDWDLGNIVHEMHILLGRVALETGDLEKADLHLLKAARTPGSPQLASFGPDWTLARDLLQRGRREAVTAYVTRVGAFWESGRDRLAEWSNTLADGGTPKFLPERKREEPKAPKERKEIGEPPPLAVPDGLLGHWESVARSDGGIGHALEFLPDGRMLMHMLFMGEAKYRVDGERLVVADEDGEESLPLGTIRGDAWTVTFPAEDGEPEGRFEKKRVGAATTGVPAIVGVWTYDRGAGIGKAMIAFERYDADGWLRYRSPMPGITRESTYERKGDVLRVTADGRTVDNALSLKGDRLRLGSGEETAEYRYAGRRPWYRPESKEPVEAKAK